MEKSHENTVINVKGDEYASLEQKDDEETYELTSHRAPGVPWIIWFLLIFALVFSSASGAIMLQMETDRAAAISIACWRFQVTTLVMFPFFIWQCLFISPEQRKIFFKLSTFAHILLSGIGLALYFSLWNWSMEHTSLTHSFFLSAMSPIFVAAGTVIFGGSLFPAEIGGVALGITGSLIIAMGSQSESGANVGENTLTGDVVALLSSSGMALYLTSSGYLRGSTLPMYVYMFPSTLVVSIVLGLAAIFLEGWGSWGPSNPGIISGPFGWLTLDEANFLLPTIFLGIGPGFLCYVIFNIVLAYTSSLTLSLGLSVCPLSGSLMGWAAGLSNTPSILTCLGGILTMAATVTVSWAKQPEKQRNKDQVDAESYFKITEDEIGEAKVPLLKNCEPA